MKKTERRTMLMKPHPSEHEKNKTKKCKKYSRTPVIHFDNKEKRKETLRNETEKQSYDDIDEPNI